MVEIARCARSLDVLFLLDQSGSVSVDDWQKEKEFAAQLAEGLAKLYANPQFGVIVFGPPSVPWPLSQVASTQISQQIRNLPGCQEHFAVNDRSARTCTTPTDQALALARQQFSSSGRNDTSRILFLVTDGNPETGEVDGTPSQSLANQTLTQADAAKKQGISIVTVGIALDDATKALMNQIASKPPEDYSYPNVASFDGLITRLPTILASSCFYVQDISPFQGCPGEIIAVTGENLFGTDALLRCRFTYPSGDQIIVRAHHFNNTLMHCTVPESLDMAETAVVEVTTDGRGYTSNGLTFQYWGNCSHENVTTVFGVVTIVERDVGWWPWLFFLLLPLLCCLLLCGWWFRRRKPKEQHKPQAVSTTEAMPEDEAFQLEGLETNSVLPSTPTKWKVQPSAYIGFGKGKMDVNWNGEAPDSAPHALKRQPVPTDTLSGEGVPSTPARFAHIAGRDPKRRGCWPWLCCIGDQEREPQYPHNEGEEQHLAVSVPRVVFHADSGHVGTNTNFESKNDVEG